MVRDVMPSNEGHCRVLHCRRERRSPRAASTIAPPPTRRDGPSARATEPRGASRRCLGAAARSTARSARITPVRRLRPCRAAPRPGTSPPWRRRRERPLRVCSVGDMRALPLLGRGAGEGLPLVGHHPRRTFLGRRAVDRRPQVQCETEQARVPPDPGRGRTELLPHVVGDVRDAGDVLELQARALVARRGEPHGDPGHVPAELPRRVIARDAVRGWAAFPHHATGVALELIAAAEPRGRR